MSDVDAAANGRRWWVLATVCCAQFIFGVDALAVNVALPTMAGELHASPAQLQAVMALYFVGYATLVVTGGRLGDIFGTRNVFFYGVLGFTLTSLWCGCARSGTELVLARTAQGAAAALMIPQVLATLHVLFNDRSRALAFGVYGIVLGVAGAGGFLLGGLLVTADVDGFGWRTIFFLNVPVGIVIMAATLWLMPARVRRPDARLDIPGAIVLFLGLLCLVGPLPWGRDFGWSVGIWAVTGAGVLVLIGFVRLEFHLAAHGAMPLVDIALFKNSGFMRGLSTVFFVFFANLSFYLVTSLYVQQVLHVSPLGTGFLFVPAALIFVFASQHGVARGKRDGVNALIGGAAVQLAGLVALGFVVGLNANPPLWLVASAFAIYAYGQGLVLAPMSSAVLAYVPPAAAGAASGMYATIVQAANAAGLAAVGAIYLTAAGALGAAAGLLAALSGIGAAILAGVAALRWMRSVTGEGGPAIINPLPHAGDAGPEAADPRRPAAEIA
jgi:MFS family permease